MIEKLFANTVYVKVYTNRFELKEIESGNIKSVISPEVFTTKRMLVGQFLNAEKALRNGIKSISKHRWYAASPFVVIQPMEVLDGGLSEVEIRIFKELATSAGARNSVVWVGHELSDNEVVEKVNGV